MYNFSIQASVSSDACTATREIFDQVLDCKEVAEICGGIAMTMSRADACQDEEKKNSFVQSISQLKRRLPGICWHASAFNEGKRSSKNAIQSRLVMMDIDHIEKPSEEFERVREEAMRIGLVAAHITPSTKGLRLVFVRPEMMTIAEAQQWIAEKLCLTNVDGCVKDLARLSFVVPRAYWFHIDYDALFGEKTIEVPVNQEELKRQASDLSNQQEKPQVREISISAPQKSKVYGQEYMGIPYRAIVEALEDLYGGKPVHGNRNNIIFLAANLLRNICNNDPEWVAQILPTYGEAEYKWFSTIKSACRMSLPATMPTVLQRAIEMARQQMEIPEDDRSARAFTEKAPAMPEKLPRLIAHLIKNVPEVCRPSVANGVFPALATHLTDVRFRLIDGRFQGANLMHVCMAGQSSGKSAMNKPIEYIMADIKAQDEINRGREQEWKDAVSSKGANKEKPQRPDDLCIRIICSDCTNAAFVQRLKDARGKYVFTQIEELDLLRQLQTNGTDIGKIICLAFDNGNYGQERVGNQSITAQVPIKWNWNAATTPEKGMDFFRGNRLIDGTLSRINFSTIINDFSKEFKYGDYDENYATVLKPYIANLNLCRGEVVCQEALEMAERLQKKCKDIAMQTEDVIYQEYAFRAVTLAFLKAMVLYIANGDCWDETIEAFCEWSLDYDLWVKNYLFGDAIEQARNASRRRRSRGRVNMLTYLPDIFTFQDAEEMRRRNRMGTEQTGHMLRQWVSRGLIVLDDDKVTYEKTEEYKRRR